MINPKDNVAPDEIAKFTATAKDWWNKNGEMRMLHQLNPLRLNYIKQQVNIAQQKICDVGCGGGILSESMAAEQADVLGIDMSAELIKVAQTHAAECQLSCQYQQITVEALAAQCPQQFDIVTCMELLEHVPNPASVIKACGQLIKPGGYVFFSTLNRNAKAFLLAILGAEYLLNLLPKGTHHYAKFIKPSELRRWASECGLKLHALQGIEYNPISKQFRLSENVDVNYLACFKG